MVSGILSDTNVLSIINVLHNSLTLYKRVTGSKRLCPPSHRYGNRRTAFIWDRRFVSIPPLLRTPIELSRLFQVQPVQLPLFANSQRPDAAVYVAQRRGEERADQRTAAKDIGRLVGVHQRPGQYRRVDRTKPMIAISVFCFCSTKTGLTFHQNHIQDIIMSRF